MQDAWLEMAMEKQRRHTEETRNRNQKEVARMSNATVSEYQARAQEFYNKMHGRMMAIEADALLSSQGKREAQGVAQAEYQARIEALQTEASAGIAKAKAAVDSQLRTARAEKAEALRTLLGDQLLAQLYKDRMANMPPAKVVWLLQDASAPWEAALLRELAWNELDRRYAAKPNEIARNELSGLEIALRDLEPAQSPELLGLEHAANDLRDTQGLLDGLDIAARAGQMSSLYGVTAAGMAEAMSTD